MHCTSVITENDHASLARQVSTPLGAFDRIGRAAANPPHEEWMLTLADDTEIVVGDQIGEPNRVHLEKAAAIIPNRARLGRQAVLLIAPFLKGEGAWRLLTIDFGAEARRYGSEFLMCFAFVRANATLSPASPYVEVGFSLASAQAEAPLFLLTVKAVRGIPLPHDQGVF